MGSTILFKKSGKALPFLLQSRASQNHNFSTKIHVINGTPPLNPHAFVDFSHRNHGFLPFLCSTSKRITSINPHYHTPKLTLVRFSTRIASLEEDPLPNSHFMVRFLVSKFGFPLERALKLSQKLAHLKSTENSDSVLLFLREHGFSDTNITSMVSRFPDLLCARPETSLRCNMKVLLDMGIAGPVLTQMLVTNPKLLMIGPAVPRIQYWRDFFDGDDQKLLKALKTNTGLICQDLSAGIAPKMSILQKLGLTKQAIEVLLMSCRIITSSTDTIETLAGRLDKMGLDRNSKMLVHYLVALSKMPEEILEKKIRLFKGFGWSKDEFLMAFRKAPYMPLLSEKIIETKINFLMEEAGCEYSYIVAYPMLLSYNLEKRLRLRYSLCQLLKAKGFPISRSIASVMMLPMNKFVEKLVIPYKGIIPEAYIAFVKSAISNIQMESLQLKERS